MGSIPMNAQPLLAEEVSLSQGEALQAFQRSISAELLHAQCHWLAVESRRQKRTKTDLLTHALGLWIHRHPEERLTKARLFNVMREAVGELIVVEAPSA
jgi:hypothetical protein